MNRGLIGFLSAEAISITGTTMSMVAVPWFVLVTTGSAAMTGLVAFAQALLFVVTLGTGGLLVDTYGARRVAMIANLVAGVSIAAVPVLYHLNSLPIWLLASLVALEGAARGAGTTTNVLLPGLAEQAGTPIERATGLHSTVSRSATVLGAPLAGVLIAVWSPPAVLFIDALTFAVAAVLIQVCVSRSVEPPRTKRSTSDSMTGHYFNEMRTGLRFMRNDPLLLAIALMVFGTNLLDQAYAAVLVPVWAKDVIGSPLALGLVSGTFAVGAACGAGVFAWRGPRLPRYRTYAWGFLVTGAPRFVVLALVTQLPPALTVSLISGMAAGAINPVLGATMYERIPRVLQARVLGAVGAVAWAGVPLGALVGGFGVSAVGLTATCVVLGAVYALMTMLPFVQPVWRQLDSVPETANTGE